MYGGGGGDGYIGRMMLRMELPGMRKRGRSKRRYMDAVREDMAVVGVTEEDASKVVTHGDGNSGEAERRRRSKSAQRFYELTRHAKHPILCLNLVDLDVAKRLVHCVVS